VCATHVHRCVRREVLCKKQVEFVGEVVGCTGRVWLRGRCAVV